MNTPEELAMQSSMRLLLCGLALALAGQSVHADPFPTFRMQEIEKGLTVGYAVRIADLNRDGKKDILVVDSRRLVWYENPSWKAHDIARNQTRPDNVCFALHDIDGDGDLDIALGAQWNPGNTKSGGTLQWLQQGKTLSEWTIHPIAEVPTLHRIRFADLYGTGKPLLLVGPLFGQGSSREKNWMDKPVHLRAFRIPENPARDRWEEDVLASNLHVMHNFWPIPAKGRTAGSGKGMDVLTASYEGVGLVSRQGDAWKWRQIGRGNQENPKGRRGTSEVKQGKLKGGTPVIATIEPWHGHEVVVYTPPSRSKGLWERHVLDDRLRWGHAVWFADLDGDGGDELIVGVRDHLSKKPGEQSGVRIYRATDGTGKKWERRLIDEGGVRVEDLAADDLDGDGRIDLVAVGRASHNARIYWNRKE
jgi:hypothetical protein